MEWADSLFLAPYILDKPTSLRSDRTIDYIFATGTSVSVQAYDGTTVNDHLPIFTNVPFCVKKRGLGTNTHWKVFSLFSEYTSSFWEKNWDLSNLDLTYNNYTEFLYLLSCRCTTVFPLSKYRSAIPSELRSLLSYVRALSFRLRRKHDPNIRNKITFLKKFAKSEIKKYFSTRIDTMLNCRNSSSSIASQFWSKCKKHIKSSSTSISAFIAPDGRIVKDAAEMSELGADFYELHLKKSDIYLLLRFTSH